MTKEKRNNILWTGLLCLLLLLPLTVVHAEAVSLRLQQEPVLEHTVLVEGSYSYTFAEVTLANYDELHDQYGTQPVWSVEHISGPEMEYILQPYGPTVQFVMQGSQTLTPGTTVLKLRCTWAGMELERTFTVETLSLSDAYPVSLIFPQTTIKLGESMMIRSEDILPECWPKNLANERLLANVLTLNGGSVRTVFENGVLTLTPQGEAGVHKIRLHYSAANCILEGSFYLLVADETNTVPMPKPQFTCSDLETTWYLNSGDSQSAQFSGVFMDTRIQNYSPLYDFYRDEPKPQWDMKCLSGDGEVLKLNISQAHAQGSTYSSCGVQWKNEPEKSGDIRIRITCSWVGTAFSQEYVVHVIAPDCPAPTGLDLPEEIVLEYGETYTFPRIPSVLPNNWNLAGETQECYCSWTGILDHASDEDHVYITGSEPGIGFVTFCWNCANYELKQKVLVKVKDEEGNEPQLEPKLERSIERSRMGTQDRFTMETVAYCYVSNMELLSQLTESVVKWEVETLEGDASFLKHSYGTENELYFYPARLPEKPGKVKLKVTFTYGKYTASEILEFLVVDGVSRPYALDIPQIIQLKTDESYTFRASAVLPADWQMPEGAQASIELYGSLEDPLFDRQRRGSDIVIMARKPGLQSFWVAWEYESDEEYYEFEQEVTLLVADEENQLPLPEFDVWCGENEPQYVGGQNFSILEFVPSPSVLAVYEQLMEAEVVWTVEPLKGDIALEVLFVKDEGGAVRLKNALQQPGEYAYRLKATIGEFVWSEEFSFTAAEHPMGIPSRLTFPSRIEVQRGKSFIMSTDHVEPAGWTAEEAPYLDVIDGPDAFFDAWVCYDDSENWMVLENGVYPLTLEWSCCNFRLRQDVVLVVTENGPGSSLAELNRTQAVLNVNTRAKPFWLLENSMTVQSVAWSGESSVISQDGFVMAAAAGTYSVEAEVTFAGGASETLTASVTVLDLPQTKLPQQFTTAQKEAFAGSGVQHVVLPQGAASIGSGAFSGCTDLYLIEIPDSVTAIEADAFTGSSRTVILCRDGSEAQTFAQRQDMPYYLIP